MMFHMEMRNVSLETVGKVILVIRWQRAQPNCVLGFVEGRTSK